MGEVVYGVVFGKPKTEDQSKPSNVSYIHDSIPSFLTPAPFLIPFWDWPSDTEPPDESA